MSKQTDALHSVAFRLYKEGHNASEICDFLEGEFGGEYAWQRSRGTLVEMFKVGDVTRERFFSYVER
jgi:hypothetical protein